MSETLSRPTAHMSCRLETPHIYALEGYPRRYAIHLGQDLSIHCTAEEWKAFNTIVMASFYGPVV